jgi:glycosyltransferase involved in cell wall biosynthesis
MIQAKTSWICSQLGAREHYAIPRALSASGKLVRLYTEFWAGARLHRLSATQIIRLLRPVHSLSARYHPDLNLAPVSSWNFRSLYWEFSGRYLGTGASNPYHRFIDIGRAFSVAVRDSLNLGREISDETVFFTYDTGALETFEWLKKRGTRCFLAQMDPSRVEVKLVREEEQRWPGWQPEATDVPEEYFRRREREWDLADKVLVNSEFTKRALIEQGVDIEKIVVIPLCYEKDHRGEAASRIPTNDAQLRVLWLGQVILRKGIQYLIGAARLLAREKIHFDVVGPIGISTDALASAPSNMTFHGRASRDQVGFWYRNADLFVLPTISDGFGLTQLEAMAHGLPVIATTNCGDVVSQGIDGMIVQSRNAIDLANAICRYRSEPQLLREHRSAALTKAGKFSLTSLANNLTRLEQELL